MSFKMKFPSAFGKSNNLDNDIKYESLKEALMPAEAEPHHLEAADDSSLTPKRIRPLYQRLPGILVKILVVSLALIGLTNLIVDLRAKMWPAKSPSCNCGDTPQESLAMGCRFDSLFHGWLQPHCIDEELTAEFERSGPGPNGEYQWYLDINGTVPINQEEKAMLPNDVRVYSTLDWHLNHCFFYWRKLYRSKYLGTVLEGKYDNEFHIKHCTMKAFQHTDFSRAIGTTAYVYLDPDHSVHELHWPSATREMWLHDHNLKYPNGKIDESMENYR